MRLALVLVALKTAALRTGDDRPAEPPVPDPTRIVPPRSGSTVRRLRSAALVARRAVRCAVLPAERAAIDAASDDGRAVAITPAFTHSPRWPSAAVRRVALAAERGAWFPPRWPDAAAVRAAGLGDDLGRRSFRVPCAVRAVGRTQYAHVPPERGPRPTPGL